MSNFRSILPKDPEERRRATRPARSQEPEEEGQRRSDANRVSYSGTSGREERLQRSAQTRSRNRRPSRSGQRQQGKTPFFFFILAGIILLFLLVPAGLKLYSTSRQLADAQKAQTKLEEERKQLSASVEELKNQLKMVNTDEYVEKYAHEKLGMIRPNEILFQTEDGRYKLNEEAVRNLTQGQVEESSEGTSSESTSGSEGSAFSQTSSASQAREDQPTE